MSVCDFIRGVGDEWTNCVQQLGEVSTVGLFSK